MRFFAHFDYYYPILLPLNANHQSQQSENGTGSDLTREEVHVSVFKSTHLGLCCRTRSPGVWLPSRSAGLGYVDADLQKGWM